MMKTLLIFLLVAVFSATHAQERKLTYKRIETMALHPDQLLSYTLKSHGKPKDFDNTLYVNVVYNDSSGYLYHSFKKEKRYQKKSDTLYGSKPVHHDIYYDLINLKEYDYSDFKTAPTLISFNIENSPLVFMPINSIDSLKYRTGYFINDRNLMVYFVLRKQEEAGFLYRKFPGVVLSYYIPNYNYYLQLMKEETGHFSITKPDLPIVYPKK